MQIARVHLDCAAFGGSDRHPAVEVDGRRHYKTIVVVSVLADQVDASGRAVEKAILSVKIPEMVLNIHRPGNSAGRCAGRNRSDAANHQTLPSHVLDNLLRS